jgi:4-amino-4-deoxy-L-arabinose transferase-like glycosyltransferase
MLLQIASGSALAATTAAVAARLFRGWLAPLTAGTLVACHPGLAVYSASRSHPLAFDALFLMLPLLLCARLSERPTLARAVLLGVTIGAGTLSRATVFLWLPLSVAWLLIVMPSSSWRIVVRCAIVATISAAAVIAPWSIRNSILHHEFVPLLSTGGEMFWRGNNPYASGTSYVDTSRTVLEMLSPSDRRELQAQPNELAQSRWFGNRARAFVRTQPAQFVRLTFRKLFFFWWYAPQTGIRYPGVWFHLYMAYYVFVLGLAAVGAWVVARAGGSRWFLALLAGGFMLALSVFQSLYYVEGRHRWGIEAIVIAFSGGGLAALWSAGRRRLAGGDDGSSVMNCSRG